MSRERILIAEYDIPHRQLLRGLLESRGYHVTEAATGAEVLIKILEFDPSIVLLDAYMPGREGLSSIRQLRSHPRYGELFVVALGSETMRPDWEAVMASGFDEYISNPIDAEELFLVLERRVMDLLSGLGRLLKPKALHVA